LIDAAVDGLRRGTRRQRRRRQREEGKEKRKSREATGADRKKKTTPNDATNFSFLAFEHVWSSRAKEE